MVFLDGETVDARDSAVTKNGAFHFTRKITKGEVYNLWLGRSYGPGTLLVLYVDKGVINISARDGVWVDMHVGGSQYAEDYSDYLNTLKANDILRRNYDIQRLTEEAERKQDKAAGQSLYRQFLVNDSLKQVIEMCWVAEHLASPISCSILFSRRFELRPGQLDSAFHQLTEEAKNNGPGRRLGIQVVAVKNTHIGDFAPLFTQADTAGHPVALKDFRGRYVLLDFWASWCAPCRAENPTIIAAYNKYKSKGFTVLSVSLDENKESWLSAVYKDGLPWTQVSDLQSWDNAVGMQYNVHRVPANFLIDKEGKIIATDLRGDDLGKKLQEVLP